MEWSEINKMFIKAVQIYYYWLKHHSSTTKDNILYRIKDLLVERKEGKYICKALTIDKNLPTPLNIYIEGRRISNVEIVERRRTKDGDEITFVIQGESCAIIHEDRLTKENIIFGFDLIFLVERLEHFYKEETDYLNLHVDRLAQFEEEDILIADYVSEKQSAIIKDILLGEKPVSYVWGAAGTGKTKVVLAHVALNYLRKGIPMLIVAPTNIAIETAISAVIELAKEFNVDYGGVKRYGMPSQMFALKYPTACGEYEKFLGILQSLEEELKVLEDEQREETLKIWEYQKEKESLEKDPIFKYSIFRGTNRANAKKERIVKIEERIKETENSIRKIEERITSLRGEHKYTIAQYTDNTTIFGCTVDYYIASPDKFVPKHVLIDEAAYCSLIRGVTLLQQRCPITMFGDHMQLQPICEMSASEILRNRDQEFQNTLVSNEIITDVGEIKEACVWDMSILYLWDLYAKTKSRLINTYKNEEFPERIDGYFLTETYRYSKELAEVLDAYVYQKGLIGVGDASTNIKYILVNGTTTSNRNDKEVDAVELLISRYETFQNVGVLCPYRNQQQAIERRVGWKFPVFTVHKAQGQEYDTVILSVTDDRHSHCMLTNSKMTSGLTCLNTAVSRAKKELIIVCHPAWLEYEVQLIYGLIKNGTELH